MGFLNACLQTEYCPALKQAIDSLPEAAMWAGVAISIMGVAGVFFAGLSSLYAAGFALLGLITFLGTFWARQYASQEALIATQKKLEKETKQLEQINLSLTQTNEELKAANQAHVQANADLVARIRLLQQTSEKIRNQLLVLKGETATLNKTRSGFEQFGRQLESNLSELDRELGASRALCAQISDVLKSQKDDISQGLHQLNEILVDLKTNESTNEKFRQLSELQKQLGKTARQLQRSQTQVAEERALLRSLKQAYQEEFTKLEQIRGAFENTVETAREKVGASVGELAHVTTRIRGAANALKHNASFSRNSPLNRTFQDLPIAKPSKKSPLVN